MSNYRAIGGVTAVLRYLLTNSSEYPGSVLGGSTNPVTIKSPDLIKVGADEAPGVNIFMYYASLNPALRNLGLPSRSAQGDAISNPPLALNLHYLVTAYGTNVFDPEILLGWAMKVFHDTPVVPRGTIADALASLVKPAGPPAEATLVNGSMLASQIEHLRITPETLTTEEIYRLWTAFQTNYRPTTSYQVCVAVIQDVNAFTANPPVQKRSVVVLPLQSPVITSLSPTPITAGGTLTIRGSNFLGDTPNSTLVSFDDATGISPVTVQGNALRVVLPGTLQAGTRSLRVLRTVTFPTSTQPHAGFSSSPTPFQLVPTITASNPAPVAQGGTLTVTISPAVGYMQQAVLYVGDIALPIDQRPSSGPPTSATLAFPIPKTIAAGIYPLRVEIDGAQSNLTLDNNPAHPTYGQYLPQVKVTA